MSQPSTGTPPHSPARARRALLWVAAAAVAFAAADTYVVVLALPDMMAGVGISAEELQRAAPIVSGFLLGYVAMLPLIGRIADLRGRPPVLAAGLVVFAAGSLVTALAVDLPTMVTGRFLQGVGGGALVPATLALVADLYPVERRGVPLGLVSAVQEIGAVLGPLLGAAVLAVGDWRAIFALNLVVAALLALGVRVSARRDEAPRPRDVPEPVERRLPDVVGLVLLVVGVVGLVLLLVQPGAIMRNLTWGLLYVPVVGSGDWLTPLGLVTIGAGLAFGAWSCLAPSRVRRLVDLSQWWRTARQADLTGSLLLAVALGGVVLAFATADPQVHLLSPQGGWYLLGSALAALALAVHLRLSDNPLVPRGALRRTPAWGSVVVSFLVGVALVAALIDVPLFARTTVATDSQLGAALVLVRFLLALPVGAVVGGHLVRRLSPGVVTALGMLLAAGGFAWMATWDVHSLEHWWASGALVMAGLGFGLALAPVNAAVLASTAPQVHGIAGALVVVARMIGMLVGVSALTAIGLRRFYAEQAGLPPVQQVCEGRSRCGAYLDLLQEAGIAQEQTVFAGAAVVALLAAATALPLLRERRADRVS